MRRTILLAALVLGAGVSRLDAQQAPPAGTQHAPGMQHTTGMRHEGPAAQPTQAGQAAFAAVTEIVNLLEADSTTDWSRVDLEALRQHLIDMDDVTLRARVRSTRTPGGLILEVTGTPPVAAAIRRMVGAHAPVLEQPGGWRATAAPVPGGMRLTVVARDTADAAGVTRIRGLGFIGLMTRGAHHAAHHLMIAKGAGTHAHDVP